MNFDDVRKKLDYDGADELSSGSDEPAETSGAPASTEAIAVYLRVRPFTADDVTRGNKKRPYDVLGKTSVALGSPREQLHAGGNPEMHMVTTYTFSEVFDETSSQQAVFETSMLSTVKQFLAGHDCLVFAYGMTNSGKTFTMQGSAKDPGIIPRSLNHIFSSLDGRLYHGMDLKPKMFADVVRLSPKEAAAEVATKSSILNVEKLPVDSTFMSQTSSLMLHSSQSSLSESDEISADAAGDLLDNGCDDNENSALGELADREPTQYSVWLSFAEIYNEQIYDLLEPAPSARGVPLRRKLLKMAEDKHGQPYVKDLRSVCVCSAEDAARIIAVGQKNLQYACTRLNESSSRSHCIITLRLLHVVDAGDGASCASTLDSATHLHVTRVNTLTFCDLAGSERCSRTQSAGDRLKEAVNINASMLTLGRCISALRDITQHQQSRPRGPPPNILVPFRESKLTRLFQNFFCGKGKVSMIVNVSQCHSDYDENLHALKFSAIAQKSAFVPVKPEFKVPAPVRRKSSRLLSIAISAALDVSRPSIPWATPGTIASLGEVGQRVSLLMPPAVPPQLTGAVRDDEREESTTVEPQQQHVTHPTAKSTCEGSALPAASEACQMLGAGAAEDDESSADDDDDDLVQFYQHREKQFRQAIEELTKALVAARQEAQEARLAADAREKAVRAEICSEWKADIARLEEQHRARLEEERDSARHLMDQKVELIEDFVHKSAVKRGRWQRRSTSSESDDEDVAAGRESPLPKLCKLERASPISAADHHGDDTRYREKQSDETNKENLSNAFAVEHKTRPTEMTHRERANPSSACVTDEKMAASYPNAPVATDRIQQVAAGVQGRSLRNRQPCGGGGGGSPKGQGCFAGGNMATLAVGKLGSAIINSPFVAHHTKTSMMRLQANSETPGKLKAEKCMDNSCFLNRPEKRKAAAGPDAETRSSSRKRRHMDIAAAAAAADGTRGAAAATAAASRQRQQQRRVSSVMRQRYEMRKRNKRH